MSGVARIRHYGIETRFRSPFDCSRNSSDAPNALGCCQFALRSCERTLGRRFSAIHILTGRLMNAPRLPTGGGVDVGERRPRAALYEPSVDKVQDIRSDRSVSLFRFDRKLLNLYHSELLRTNRGGGCPGAGDVELLGAARDSNSPRSEEHTSELH